MQIIRHAYHEYAGTDRHGQPGREIAADIRTPCGELSDDMLRALRAWDPQHDDYGRAAEAIAAAEACAHLEPLAEHPLDPLCYRRRAAHDLWTCVVLGRAPYCYSGTVTYYLAEPAHA